MCYLLGLYKDGLTKCVTIFCLFVCVSVFISDCQCSNLTFMMLPTSHYDTFCPLSNFCAYGLYASQYQYISSVHVCMLHIYHSFEPEKSPYVCMKIRLTDPVLLSFTAVCINWESGWYSVLACTIAKTEVLSVHFTFHWLNYSLPTISLFSHHCCMLRCNVCWAD